MISLCLQMAYYCAQLDVTIKYSRQIYLHVVYEALFVSQQLL
jgi:hypothetical protein